MRRRPKIEARPTIRRQSRGNKARFCLRWDNMNYDYLIQRAQAEDVSVAAIANRIIRNFRLSKESEALPRQ